MTSIVVHAQDIQPKSQTVSSTRPRVRSNGNSTVIVITTSALVLLVKKRFDLNKNVNFIPF